MAFEFYPEEQAGYYRALGQFVSRFAEVEGVLFLYLYTFAGVDENTAKAVLSGVRVHDGVSFIKRIAYVRNTTLSAELEEVLSQLLIINDARNLILHHPMQRTLSPEDHDSITRFIDNFDRALTEERGRKMQISQTLLMNMERDLSTIGVVLLTEYFYMTDPDFKRMELPILKGPWLYEPAPKPKKQ
jgi:hypothetical protein